jgi:FixJ family two-component response regulator
MNVELFRSPEEYFRRSTYHSPNCIVLDVRLPAISGLDLQSRLATARLPLVFPSAQNEVTTSAWAMKAGP